MSIGFKEWALVCDAIGRGEQSVIIRKGGIHEGRHGFRFEHEEFFLFPTLFHEQVERTRLPPGTALPAADAGTVAVSVWVRVEWTQLVTDLEAVRALAPFHVLRDEIVEERFRYDEPQGVNVAFLRAWRLAPEWKFPSAPKYGGCRSWVTLPDPPEGLSRSAALEEPAHAARAAAVSAAIGR